MTARATTTRDAGREFEVMAIQKLEVAICASRTTEKKKMEGENGPNDSVTLYDQTTSSSGNDNQNNPAGDDVGDGAGNEAGDDIDHAAGNDAGEDDGNDDGDYAGNDDGVHASDDAGNGEGDAAGDGEGDNDNDNCCDDYRTIERLVNLVHNYKKEEAVVSRKLRPDSIIVARSGRVLGAIGAIGASPRAIGIDAL